MTDVVHLRDFTRKPTEPVKVRYTDNIVDFAPYKLKAEECEFIISMLDSAPLVSLPADCG